MRFAVTHGYWRFYIGLVRLVNREGVCSTLPSGKHILMWDFDNIPLWAVKDSLKDVQMKFKLPRIWIIYTGKLNHYHAYCFKDCYWCDAVRIVVDTDYCDKTYIAIAVGRGYFTLRVTRYAKRKFTPAEILPSKYKEDVDPFELGYIVKYKTSKRGEVCQK